MTSSVQPKDFTLLQKVLLIALVFGTPVVIWYVNRPSAASTPKTVTLNVLTAATSTAFTCGTSTVQDQDGNTYNTVLIGSQCWMKQNMRVGTYVPISATTTYQTNNGTIEKWCYSDTLANCMTNNNPNNPDGGLYQWNEAMQYSTTPGARGICPVGWHIPTHDELTTLERAVCTSGTCATDFPYDITTTGWRGTTEGTKLKPNGVSGWEGNLAGYGWSGSFNVRGTYGYFWSSSESGGNAWSRDLDSAEARVGRDTIYKAFGLSVRCLRDSSDSSDSLTPSATIGLTLPTAPSLASGTVAHVTFDGPDMDWASTTAEVKDRVSAVRRYDAVNMSTQSPAIGKLGQGMGFNGTNQYIPLGSLGTVRSVSFWLKPDDTTVRPVLDINGTARVELDASSQITATNWTSPVYYVDAVAGARTITTDWRHVVVTSATGLTASAFEIGRAGGAYYDGVLDDVRIFDRVITPAEVKRLYQLGLGVTVDGFVCGQSRVQDRDLNWYDTVQVGTQCWMKQNMRVGTMVTVATTQTNNGTIEKWCYSNTLANCMTNNNPNYPDGGLYQWDEAMQYSTTPGARGICPQGFHIPTDAEQYTLENYLKDSGQTCNASRSGYDCSTAGTKLKPNGTSGWEGNLAGRGWSGSFGNRGTFGNFWSSSESGGNAWYRYLYSAGARVGRDTDVKANGLSVRCLRDS